MTRDPPYLPPLVDDSEPSAVLYQHTVLCQTALPYRDPGDAVRAWEREQGAVALKVRAGEVRDLARGGWIELGLPYGPKPRLILAHLNAEALRTGSPEIEVEGSLTAFVRRLGLDTGGRTIRSIKDQLARLAAAEIRLAVAYSPHEVKQVQAHLIGAFDLWLPKDDHQRVLWPSVVELDPRYFESLKRHAVPLDEQAIAALAHSAMALDVYAWLAQRLHRVPAGKPQFVPWTALHDQFGQDYDRVRKFREVFKVTLKQVVEHYPAARFDLTGRGMTLHHSAPPVGGRLRPVGG